MSPADETPQPAAPILGEWQPIGTPTDRDTETTSDRRISRIHARAEEKRTDRQHGIQIRAEKRADRRTAKQAAREDRRTRRAQQRADRAEQYGRLRSRLLTSTQFVLVVFPIVAPMSVAWTGQTQFATHVLRWPVLGGIIYAAAYELTTTFCAWLYHQARSDGDLGWEYRAATWFFAAGAAVQQWWHYSDHWHATPRSVTFSGMSGIGVILWELYARLIHRRKLRKEGKLPPARPRIGAARWLRYPLRSWTARSLIILRDYETFAEAWTAAEETIQARQETKTGRDRSGETTETGRNSRRRRAETKTETAPVDQSTRSETSETSLAETGLIRETETKVSQVKPETTPRETAETTAVAIGDRSGDRDAEIALLVSLMETRGDAMKVSLKDAIRETGRPKATAAKRLKTARDLYLDETA
jgi:hypothetical protein